MADTSYPEGRDVAVAASTTEPLDGELAARALAGDEEAFEELFKRHRRRVALIASRFFRQREQIEEVVQESFAKAYFGLASFADERESSFAGWLARIAFNACYDELRRAKRRPESGADELSEDETARLGARVRTEAAGGSVESEAVTRDLAGKLLSRLSAEDRLVLVMLDAEEMSVAEIAALMKWSASKVKVRAHRARASLRRVLERFL
ncbi:MAG TPA: sigma-70 family RNA polymerase sigma factor [Pyrinomonadaceae bacterium]|nr:sigma-70 family RNA polymerase sigma factor [Pyrinomonadaceae bacterium]